MHGIHKDMIEQIDRIEANALIGKPPVMIAAMLHDLRTMVRKSWLETDGSVPGMTFCE